MFTADQINSITASDNYEATVSSVIANLTRAEAYVTERNNFVLPSIYEDGEYKPIVKEEFIERFDKLAQLLEAKPIELELAVWKTETTSRTEGVKSSNSKTHIAPLSAVSEKLKRDNPSFTTKLIQLKARKNYLHDNLVINVDYNYIKDVVPAF